MGGIGADAGNGGEGPGNCGGGAAMTIVGLTSIGMPRADEAAAAVPRLETSNFRTVSASVATNVSMVAVMITLAAVTLTLTCDTWTPASPAIFPCRPFVSKKSLTLPLATNVSTTGGGKGGGMGGGCEESSGRGGSG